MDDDGYCLGCGADFMHGEPHFSDCAPEPTGSTPAPWDDSAGCFGHCDPEGWFTPCRKPSEREPT